MYYRNRDASITYCIELGENVLYYVTELTEYRK